MGKEVLVTIEMRFRTTDDPTALAERVRESASLIVGKDHLEEFRARAMSLTPRKPEG